MRDNNREINKLEGIIEAEQTPRQHFERRPSLVKGNNFIPPQSMSLRPNFQGYLGMNIQRSDLF